MTIGNNVTSIRENAFDNCTDLKNIVLFPSVPPTLDTNAIPGTVSNIYVQQSSEEWYKTATNWIAFAEKIQSNNIYLSLVRFNKKNKEYIDTKLTKPTNPSAESAVTMLADGTVGTKPLSEIGGAKTYLHIITIGVDSSDNIGNIYILFPTTDYAAYNSSKILSILNKFSGFKIPCTYSGMKGQGVLSLVCNSGTIATQGILESGTNAAWTIDKKYWTAKDSIIEV